MLFRRRQHHYSDKVVANTGSDAIPLGTVMESEQNNGGTLNNPGDKPKKDYVYSQPYILNKPHIVNRTAHDTRQGGDDLIENDVYNAGGLPEEEVGDFVENEVYNISVNDVYEESASRTDHDQGLGLEDTINKGKLQESEPQGRSIQINNHSRIYENTNDNNFEMVENSLYDKA